MQAVEVLFIVVPNLVCTIERSIEFLHRVWVIDQEPDFLRREISIVAAVDVNAGIFDVPLLNFRANIVVQTVRNQIRNGFEIFGIFTHFRQCFIVGIADGFGGTVGKIGAELVGVVGSRSHFQLIGVIKHKVMQITCVSNLAAVLNAHAAVVSVWIIFFLGIVRAV